VDELCRERVLYIINDAPVKAARSAGRLDGPHQAPVTLGLEENSQRYNRSTRRFQPRSSLKIRDLVAIQFACTEHRKFVISRSATHTIDCVAFDPITSNPGYLNFSAVVVRGSGISNRR
jgi:hypothetical protein